MTVPDLAVGQVWRTGQGEGARELTVVTLAPSGVQVSDGYGRPSWLDPSDLAEPAAQFRGWDLPTGRLMPPIDGFMGGCLGDVWPGVAPLDMLLDEQSEAFRNGALKWWNTSSDRQTLADLEEVVLSDGETAEDDWRLRTLGAFTGAVYQRQAPGRWVLVRRLDGYA
ncbi:hypothetical protein [Frankia sp. AgW1.1]|uniref:hypothetical protein n=1 Tax=Frankia sp. AgW1.1 TaxID=1836971 RepID=UPI0019315E9E|nr:hypothetical protein [Frankia sp. AgW1.1]MBL7487146.1 hypothetical protein [Frankia sp. AgW1.1]